MTKTEPERTKKNKKEQHIVSIDLSKRNKKKQKKQKETKRNNT